MNYWLTADLNDCSRPEHCIWSHLWNRILLHAANAGRKPIYQIAEQCAEDLSAGKAWRGAIFLSQASKLTSCCIISLFIGEAHTFTGWS